MSQKVKRVSLFECPCCKRHQAAYTDQCRCEQCNCAMAVVFQREWIDHPECNHNKVIELSKYDPFRCPKCDGDSVESVYGMAELEGQPNIIAIDQICNKCEFKWIELWHVRNVVSQDNLSYDEKHGVWRFKK